MIAHDKPDTLVIESFFETFEEITRMPRQITFEHFDKFYRKEFRTIGEISSSNHAKEILDAARDKGLRVILATNPTVNGNATAAYISDKLNMLKIKNTRIAQGMPSGGDIGYADQLTLKNAFDGRSEMK